MSREDASIVEAKKSLKHHIKFLEAMKFHLGGTDLKMKHNAAWVAWCLNNYMQGQLMRDVEQAIKQRQETPSN